MHKLKNMGPLFLCYFFFCLLSSSFNVCVAGAGGDSAVENPFTPKAYLIRYWKKHISNDLPKPWFLLNKASPLNAVEIAAFTKLADQNGLSTHLRSFCSSAKLLCFPDLSPSLTKNDRNVHSTESAQRSQPSADGAQKRDTFSAVDAYKNPAAIKINYDVASRPSGVDEHKHDSGKAVNGWVVPGTFFREKMLKTGTVMPMPDIRDKMPQRSFLPRAILSKLPFSTSKLSELKRIFHASENSSMETILMEALSECERAPSQGEAKRCVGSGEDLIDFAVSVLGRNVAVRTTQSTDGSNHDIMIGSVKGINGGKITKSVSCHQILFPYLLYYCHSVPKVRVYEADLLDPKIKAKINHGVAICHVDTSAWNPDHAAFLTLGSGPGKIEACHWIFENEMTWTTAD